MKIAKFLQINAAGVLIGFGVVRALAQGEIPAGPRPTATVTPLQSSPAPTATVTPLPSASPDTQPATTNTVTPSPSPGS